MCDVPVCPHCDNTITQWSPTKTIAFGDQVGPCPHCYRTITIVPCREHYRHRHDTAPANLTLPRWPR